MNAARPPRRAARGFTIIELLVGMLIAMIGVIIMMQVMIDSEERNRTTTGGNDAMSSGAVMLHLLQRDVMQAGYGLNSMRLLGCSITLPTGAAGAVIPIAPVTINPPTALLPTGDANTDTVLLVYGSDSGQPDGNSIFVVNGNTYQVQAPTAFAVNDYVVAVPAAPCTVTVNLSLVTAVDATAGVTVGAANAAATGLFNFGRTPRVVGYAVRGGQLTSCDYMANDCRVNNATNWAAISGNIPSLRAVYGRDTSAGAMDGRVDAYDQTTPTTGCGWARVGAARVAVVARSNTYESKVDGSGQRTCEEVTATAPLWDGSGAAPIVLTGRTDWKCYRYRTFENLAPLRNVLWMGVSTGC